MEGHEIRWCDGDPAVPKIYEGQYKVVDGPEDDDEKGYRRRLVKERTCDVVSQFIGLILAMAAVFIWRSDVFTTNHADLPYGPDIFALATWCVGAICFTCFLIIDVGCLPSLLRECCIGWIPPYTWLITGLFTCYVPFIGEQFSTYQPVQSGNLVWASFCDAGLPFTGVEVPGYATYAMNLTSSGEQQVSLSFLVMSLIIFVIGPFLHYLMASCSFWRGAPSEGDKGKELCYHVVFYSSFWALSFFYVAFLTSAGFQMRWLATGVYFVCFHSIALATTCTSVIGLAFTVFPAFRALGIWIRFGDEVPAGEWSPFKGCCCCSTAELVTV